MHVSPKRLFRIGTTHVSTETDTVWKIAVGCVVATTPVTWANSEPNPSYTGPSFCSSKLFVFAQYFVWRKPQTHRIQDETPHNSHVTSLRNLLLLNQIYSTLLYTSWSPIWIFCTKGCSTCPTHPSTNTVSLTIMCFHTPPTRGPSCCRGPNTTPVRNRPNVMAFWPQ